MTAANESSSPVVLENLGCGNVFDVQVHVPLQVDPVGRDWSDNAIARTLKSYILATALAPGGGPAGDGSTISLNAPCGESSESADELKNIEVEPGADISAKLTWTLGINPTALLPPGTADVRVYVYESTPGTSAAASAQPGFPVGYTASYAEQHLTLISGTSKVAPISAGEAIDVMLGNPKFMQWLAQVPPKSWTVANLWLDVDGWHVEVFAEAGQARTFALATVDAWRESLTKLDICADPCSR